MSNLLSDVLRRLPRDFTDYVTVFGVSISEDGYFYNIECMFDDEYFVMRIYTDGNELITVDFNLPPLGDSLLDQIEDMYEEFGMNLTEDQLDSIEEFSETVYEIRDDFADMLTDMGYDGLKDVYIEIDKGKRLYPCETARFFCSEKNINMYDFTTVFAKVIEVRNDTFEFLSDNKIAPFHNL